MPEIRNNGRRILSAASIGAVVILGLASIPSLVTSFPQAGGSYTMPSPSPAPNFSGTIFDGFDFSSIPNIGAPRDPTEFAQARIDFRNAVRNTNRVLYGYLYGNNTAVRKSTLKQVQNDGTIDCQIIPDSPVRIDAFIAAIQLINRDDNCFPMLEVECTQFGEFGTAAIGRCSDPGQRTMVTTCSYLGNLALETVLSCSCSNIGATRKIPAPIFDDDTDSWFPDIFDFPFGRSRFETVTVTDYVTVPEPTPYTTTDINDLPPPAETNSPSLERINEQEFDGIAPPCTDPNGCGPAFRPALPRVGGRHLFTFEGEGISFSRNEVVVQDPAFFANQVPENTNDFI